MCATTQGTLTMANMLSDPLIQAVMRSDGVSAHELTELLVRVKVTLADRAFRGETALEAVEV